MKPSDPVELGSLAIGEDFETCLTNREGVTVRAKDRGRQGDGVRCSMTALPTDKDAEGGIVERTYHPGTMVRRI